MIDIPPNASKQECLNIVNTLQKLAKIDINRLQQYYQTNIEFVKNYVKQINDDKGKRICSWSQILDSLTEGF